MKVVFEVSALSVPPTGIGMYIHQTVSACATSGRGHRIVALSVGGKHETLALDANLHFPPEVERRHWAVPRYRFGPLARQVLNRFPLPTLELLSGQCDAFVSSEWLFPRQRKGLRCSIVYDLVPMRFPEWTTVETQRMHLPKLDDVRRSDIVICISQATADDVHHYLNIPRDRLRVARPGIDPRFTEARRSDGPRD